MTDRGLAQVQMPRRARDTAVHKHRIHDAEEIQIDSRQRKGHDQAIIRAEPTGLAIGAITLDLPLGDRPLQPPALATFFGAAVPVLRQEGRHTNTTLFDRTRFLTLEFPCSTSSRWPMAGFSRKKSTALTS